MIFFTRTTTWTNIQLWIFKVCVFSAGIVFGICFFEKIKEYLFEFMGIFLITVIPSVIWWIKKMNRK